MTTETKRTLEHRALQMKCRCEHVMTGACDACWLDFVRAEVGAASRASPEAVELEQYRMRLAGALTTVEGHMLDVQDDPRTADYLRTCPTIRACVTVRRRLDVAEKELAALRASPEEGRALGSWIRAFGHLHAAVAPHLIVNADDPEAMAREAVEEFKRIFFPVAAPPPEDTGRPDLLEIAAEIAGEPSKYVEDKDAIKERLDKRRRILALRAPSPSEGER